MPAQLNESIPANMRDHVLAILGGSFKGLNEIGIAMVRHFGARSEEETFSLADLRYAVAFSQAWHDRLPPPTIVDTLPAPLEDAFQRVCSDLIADGLIQPAFPDFQHREYRVRLVPAPFSEDWQFLRQLAGGGQSRTVQVRHRRDGTLGVLKTIIRADQPDQRAPTEERFRREVESLTRIEHRAIVRLVASNTDPARGEMGYVTPFGIPLETYWTETATGLSTAEQYDRAYEIVHELADGLEEVHRHGLVHRDLKPDNVILLSQQPVIIDFGLVTNAKYDAERLTEADGRQVGNHFNPPAVYGLDDRDPRRDIASLGWLYGFLLGQPIGGKRRPQRFHWQSHNLVDDPRQQRARAVLAVCSLRDSIPSTVKEFSALLTHLRLDASANKTRESEPMPSVREVANLHAESTARDTLLEAQEKEGVELAVQLFAEPLTELRSALSRLCGPREGLPITQWEPTDTEDNPLQLDPHAGVPLDHLMRQVHRQIALNSPDTTSTQLCFFYCHCGSRRRFKVSASIHFSRHYREGAFNFGLGLECMDQFGRQTKWHDVAYSLHPDGQLRNVETDKVETVDEIARMVEEWCFEERHWKEL